MDANWLEYKCKSGQTLLICNKVTGEHKCPSNSSTEEKCVMICQQVNYKELHTTGTQTDDNGCNNGCTSMYINTSHRMNITEFTSHQQEPVVFTEVELDDECSIIKDEIDATIKICTERHVGKFVGDSSEAPVTIVCNEDSDLAKNSLLYEGDGKGTTNLPEVTTETNSETTEYSSNDKDSVVDIEENRNTMKHLVELTSEDNSIKETANRAQVNLKKCLWHVTSFNGKKCWECFYCKKRCSNKFDMTCDERIHSREKPFGCSQCKKKFLHKNNLIVHIKTHTGEKPFECSHCNKKFLRKNDLKVHIKTHTGEKPFGCSQCQKKFSRKNDLNIHIKTHTGERPFGCSHCQKKFLRKNNLNVHIKTHTGEKPFECSHCKKSFLRKNDLNVHIKTHTGEKPFECSHCKKKFSRKDHLNLHVKTHSGEKPFECPYCKKKFSRKNNLKMHIKRHSGEKPFECPSCKNTYTEKSNLRRHQKTHT